MWCCTNECIAGGESKPLAVLECTLGLIWAKKTPDLGPKLCRFGMAPPYLVPTPRAATGEFWAPPLVPGRPCVNVENGYSTIERDVWGWSNGQNRTEKCCLLLACCCLLLARFKGRGVW